MQQGSISLGKIFGIRILLHWSFFLLIVMVIYINADKLSEPLYILKEVVFVLVLFFCVVLHELGHAMAAKGYGIQTRRIMLLPIGGVAQLESMPEKPGQELWVAIAGPLVNVGIAVILLPLALFAYPVGFINNFDFIFNHFLSRLILYNIFLVLFNLIPAFPMDGGRILRALLTFRFGYPKATNIAARIGQLLALGFAYIGLRYQSFLLLTGIFIFAGAEAERRMVATKYKYLNLKVSNLLTENVPRIEASTPLREAVLTALNQRSYDFIVEDYGRLVGLLTHETLANGLAEHGNDTALREVMITDFPILHPDMSAREVLEHMRLEGFTMLPVVEFDKVTGVLYANAG